MVACGLGFRGLGFRLRVSKRITGICNSGIVNEVTTALCASTSTNEGTYDFISLTPSLGLGVQALGGYKT